MDGGLVYDVFRLAFAVQRAGVFLSAITWFLSGFGFVTVVGDGGVVRFDYGSHVWHAAITDFDIVSVEYFV